MEDIEPVIISADSEYDGTNDRITTVESYER